MTETDDIIELGAICLRLGCWKTFIETLGRGRPRLYCSDACRRLADTDRKRSEARIERLQRQLRREQHYLAAIAEVIDTPEPLTKPPGQG